MTTKLKATLTASSKPQKITALFIIDQLDSMGGAERNLVQIVTSLKKQNHNPLVVCFKGGEVSLALEKQGISVKNFAINKIYNFEGVNAFLWVKKIISVNSVDVIVSYHESSDFMGIVLSLLTKIPIISSRRDMGFQLKSRHVWVYRLINYFFSHVVTVSAAVKEVISSTQWCLPNKITVIYNGVTAPPKNKNARGNKKKLRKELGLESDKLVVCCLANIRPIKGQKYLVESVKLLSEKYPDAHFVLLGRRNESHGYFFEISDLISKYKLENIIDFRGRVSPDEIGKWLSAADISVLPSLSEGFSNTILESMAAGIPVVATNVGGNPEVVRDRKSGYVVPPADPSALANAIDKLLSSESLRKKMGEAGKHIVVNEFSKKLMLDKNLDLLQYVILRCKRGRQSVQSPVKSWWQQLLPAFFRTMKDVVSTLSCKCGIYSFFVFCKKLLKLGKPKILSFHNISPGFPENYSSVLDPIIFARQISFLHKNYRVVSLDEAVHIQEKGGRLKHDVFALTFDDCYKGNYDYVLPLLKEYKIPATFFISSSPLVSCGLHAYDILMSYVEKTWKKSIDLSQFGLGVFFLDNKYNKFHFMVSLSRFLRVQSLPEQKIILHVIHDILGLDQGQGEKPAHVLNMDDFQKLAASKYVTLGGHTVNHIDLSKVIAAECDTEIKENLNFLQRYSDEPVKFFAYPFGDFPDKYHVISSLKKYGYGFAFVLGDSCKEFDPYRIERKNVHSGACIGYKKRFSKCLFALEISGLGELLFFRRLINKIKLKLYADSSIY